MNNLGGGELFSRAYLKHSGELLKDSIRFRKRIYSYFESAIYKNYELRKPLAELINRELGVSVKTTFNMTLYYHLNEFFEGAEIRDVLDSISLISRLIKDMPTVYKDWIDFVARVFSEEGLGYSIDRQGAVHYFVDQAFESNRVLSLQCLNDSKYRAVLDLLEKSYANLDSEKINTKECVKNIFEAIETLCKLITGKDSSLDRNYVRKFIEPLFQKKYQNEKHESSATAKMCSSIIDWIDAGHIYRHGQKTEEPVSPSLDFAILFLSQGTSFIRWLVVSNLK